jgi:hypothetical protein
MKISNATDISGCRCILHFCIQRVAFEFILSAIAVLSAADIALRKDFVSEGPFYRRLSASVYYAVFCRYWAVIRHARTSSSGTIASWSICAQSTRS